MLAISPSFSSSPPMSDLLSFRYFTLFPPEIQCQIMGLLDPKTILRFSVTSKRSRSVVNASERLCCIIEAHKAGLFQLYSSQYQGSSDLRRNLLPSYIRDTRRQGATLQITGPERPFHRIRAPAMGCRCERLFRGYFAAITEDSTLYVWDVRTPFTRIGNPRAELPSQAPILVLEGMHIQDVILAPEVDLIVLLCFKDGSTLFFFSNTDVQRADCRDLRAQMMENDEELSPTTEVTIKLLQWSTLSTHSDPRSTITEFIHRVRKGDNLAVFPGHQFITLQSNLLALHYFRNYDYQHRRGLVWNISTDEVLYDSDVHDPEGFRHLLLLSGRSFAVSTWTSNGKHTPGGAIELHVVTDPTSKTTATKSTTKVVGSFLLPHLNGRRRCLLTHADFYTSEALAVDPATWSPIPSGDSCDFPFASLRQGGIHAMRLQYADLTRLSTEVDSFYLLIHDRVFEECIRRWEGLERASASEMHVVDWSKWGPNSTCMTYYESFRELAMTSAVCGSRIGTVQRAEGEDGAGIARVVVWDFNDTLQCTTKDCSGDKAHFKHHDSMYPGRCNPWPSPTTTWLPFHKICSAYFELPDGFGTIETIEPFVLMAEDKVILSIRPDGDEHRFRRTWWVLPLLEPLKYIINDDEVNHLVRATPSMEWSGTVSEPDVDCDMICRICQISGLSDMHVLFECDADEAVISARDNYVAFASGIFVQFEQLDVEEAFRISMKNTSLRAGLFHLAQKLRRIYFTYDPIDFGSGGPHPAVQIFIH